MPRPKKCRTIWSEPDVNYFKPAGIRMVNIEHSNLTVDEFEAIRLKDLEGLNQKKAAEQMNISQPTLHRLLILARKKIADALVNGKAIKIHGGEYKMIARGRGYGRGMPPSVCTCPSCGQTQNKVRGLPCAQMKCSKCGTLMIRGD